MVNRPWIVMALLALCWTSGVAAGEGVAEEVEVKFGYTIVYVEDVAASVEFYVKAFGLERGFVHQSGMYAEMATGETVLAFLAHEQARANLPMGFQAASLTEQPQAVEIAFVTEDVAAAYDRALGAGAANQSAPATKPWGQTVAYVRDPDGTLVELASPMAALPPAGPSHILTILAVKDLGVARTFYDAAFGWPARVDVPVYVELELPDGRGLGLYQREGFAHNTGQAPLVIPDGEITGTEIYLHCDDLALTMERLKRAGARELSPRAPRDWGDEAAYYADPDGNVLVVARPL